MTASDGTVIGTTQVVNNGSPFSRFNIVTLSDGYQQAELGTYANDVMAFVQKLASTPPFNLVMNAINVFRVDVSSTDSGADDPVACGGTGGTARTYFDATFCNDGSNQRSLAVNNALALQVAGSQVAQYNVVLVAVNSTIYGGLGGGVGTFSRAPNASDIAIHEMGHAAFGLADEYPTLAGCGSGETGHNVEPATEVRAPNVTVSAASTLTLSRLKWSGYVLPGTSVPTMSNPDCAQCDTRPSPVASGVVGAFEGADTYHCGAFRPEYDCKMRTLAAPFCRVCSATILTRLFPLNRVSLRFAWKGVGADKGLYAGQGSDGDQSGITMRSSAAPALTTTSTGAFLAAKDPDSQGINYTKLLGPSGMTWDTVRNVPGAGSSTGPSVALFRNAVHMVWKGIEGDFGIYTTSFQGGLPATPHGIPNVGTGTRPALAVFRDRLYMAWRGVSDQNIFFSRFDGSNWLPQNTVPGVGTSATPALAVLNDRLVMVWKGIDNNQDVWFTTYDGFSWATQAPVPGVGTNSGVSLSAGPDRIFMAWRGIEGDPSLYYTTYDGRTWGTQHNYFGTGSSGVPAVLATWS
jgi:hypothetical protein